MTGKERVLAVINGWETDRPMVLPIILGAAAKLQGFTVKDYAADGELMAKCQWELWQQLGTDGVFVGADNSLEAESLGTNLFYPPDDYPYLNKPLLNRPGEQNLLVLPDPVRDGRLPELVKACQILREKLGPKAVIVAKVTGPLTIAGQLLGLEKLLFALADTPDQAASLVTFTSKVSKKIALALADHGADVIMLMDPVASPAVVPLAIFNQLAIPCYQDIFADLASNNVAGRWLQVVGPVKNLLAGIKKLELNMLTLDAECSFNDVRQKLPNICLIGNIIPMLFHTGSPENIKQAIIKVFKETASLSRVMISSSCEIPLDSKRENIQAAVSFLKELKGLSSQ
jgi:uroporphyrinogen decarboxylase